jgi:cytochrome c peroxidase
MKRTLLVLGILVLIVLLVPLANLVQTPAPRLAAAAPAAPHAKLLATLEGKCAHCHSAGTPLPFYAGLPGAKPVIAQDVAKGLDAFDLAEALPPAGGPEVALAKLEFVTQKGEMPPLRYRALHWNAALGGAERDEVLGFVREARKARYATADAPETVRTGVLQPLPRKLDLDPAKVALGRQLYHDTRLSGDGTISCATCHDLAKGGTDQAPVSTGIRGQKGGINSPTVYNAAFQVRQFWDGRAADLKEQAAGPVANPIEMGASWDDVVVALNKDKDLVKAMKAAYPDGVTKDTVTDAIAVFETSLVTTNSRFDRFLLGDEKALSAEEKRGHDAFMGRGCGTCHVGKNLGGQSFERMGRHRDYFADRGNRTDADNGRFNFTKKDADRGRFKVPILRNIAVTYPYFHDGSVKELKQAVVAMGKYQLEDPLTDAEAEDVTKFLGTLTGEIDGK